MNDSNIQLETNSRVERVDEPKSIYTDLQSYSAQVLIDKLLQFDILGEDQLNALKKRQDKVRFMNEFLRALNKESKGPGDLINIDKNEELIKFIEKAKELDKQAIELDYTAGNLERDAKIKIEYAEKHNRPDLKEIAEKEIKEAKVIRQEISELNDMSKAIKGLIDEKGIKKKLSKEEVRRVIENVNTVISDFNTLNQMNFHELNQSNQDRQSMQLMVKDLIKKLGDIILQMARGTKGG